MTPAERMLALFNPAAHAHGVYRVNGAAEPGQKRKGEALTEHSAITLDLLTRHLHGEIRIGAVPIHRGSSLCSFGAIDIDKYDALDHAALARRIAQLKLPLIVCKSKSLGAHLYAFFLPPIPAAQARERLAEWAAQLGFGNVEIFPKQDRLDGPEDDGNWINLPYHNSECHAVAADGRELALEEFLAAADAVRTIPAAPEPENKEAAAVALAARHFVERHRNYISTAIQHLLLEDEWSIEEADEFMARVCEAAGEPVDKEWVNAQARAQQRERGKEYDYHKKLAEPDYFGSEQDAKEFLKLLGIRRRRGLPFRIELVPAAWLDEKPDPLKFIVAQYLPEQTVAFCIQESGGGKTSLLVRLAFSQATGRPLFGMEVMQGPVAFIGLEDRENVFRRRVHWVWTRMVAQMQTEGCSPVEIAEARAALLANLHFVPAAGKVLQLVGMSNQSVFHTDMVAALIEELPQPLSTLIVDPIARTHALNENDTSVATTLVIAFEQVVNEVGCSVLASHHVPKSVARERIDDQYSARGGSPFVDAPRVSWRLLVANQEDVKGFDIDPAIVRAGDIVRWTVTKTNDFKKPPPLWLRRQVWDFDRWEPRADPGAQAMREIEQLYDWWLKRERKPFSKQKVEDLRADIFGAQMTQKATRAVLARAIEAEAIVATGEKGDRTKAETWTFAEGYVPPSTVV